MSVKLKRIQKPKDTVATVVLLGSTEEGTTYARSEAEQKYIQQKVSHASEMIIVNQYDRLLVLLPPVTDKSGHLLDEAYRKKGLALFGLAKAEKIDTWQVQSDSDDVTRYSICAKGCCCLLIRLTSTKRLRKTSRQTLCP